MSEISDPSPADSAGLEKKKAHGTGPDNVSVEIDGSATAVPLLAYQSIYKSITDKSDSFTKYYKDNILLEHEHITQLHAMIGQACQQYQIKAANNSVTIFHSDDTKETFSSFKIFRP